MQKQVFNFVAKWFFAYDLGLTAAECNDYALDATFCCSIAAARARNLIRNAGFAV